MKRAPLAVLAAVQVALAQQSPGDAGTASKDAAASEPTLLDEITVTGSRAALPGFSASTPTTVVSGLVLAREGATNLAQVLDAVPGFKNSQSPASNGARTATVGSSTADLRGLGAQRTLVLVDGARVPPTAPTTNSAVVTTVDLNTIPSLMIDRVEVVTGGASAQWGSDAVAGVVNVIIKDDFQGLEIKAQGGQTERGDGDTAFFGLLTGTSFAGDSGHIVLGAEYQKDDGLGDVYTRKNGHQEAQYISNANFLTNGLPAGIIADNAHSALGAGGVITGPANFSFRNFTFNPDGTTRPFQVGSFSNGTQMIGGEGQSIATGFDMIPSFHRVASYFKTSYDITSAITGSVTLSYSDSYGVLHGSTPRITARTIQRDNAFLPTNVVAAMTTANITSFTFQRSGFDLGNTSTIIEDKVPRAVASLKGTFGESGSWDVNYERGQDRYHQTVENSTSNPNLTFALDAVKTASGDIVCRATQPGAAFNAAAVGCVPINLFGDGAPSAAARAYVQQTGESDSRYNQHDASANLKGKPFETWAGPVAVATGVEYRRETQDVTASALAQANVFLAAGNAAPFTGSYDVKEVYVDTIVPLLSEMTAAKSLSFSGAFRFEDYSNIGNQNTWKAGLDYRPIQSLRFRVTRSTDIRAPAIYELFGGGQALSQPVTVNGRTAVIPLNVTLGNPNLTEENATTTTGGIVFSPRGALGGLVASLDYFDVSIDNAISSLGFGTIATLCTGGNQQFCQYFTFNPTTGAPTRLNATVLNVATVETKGLDFELAYSNSLPEMFGQETSITAAVRGSYTLHSFVNTGGGAPTIDRADENGQNNLAATPRLRMNLSQQFRIGKLSATLQELFISAGQLDNTFNSVPALSINDNSVPSITYLNVYGSYDATDALQLFLSVRNALDKDPPVTPNTTLPIPPYNGQLYDVLGRSYRVGFGYRF